MSAVLQFPNVYRACAGLPITAPSFDSAVAHQRIHDYAVGIGCDPSNVTAAISFGIKHGFSVSSAVEQGQRRADVLRARQPKVLA